MLDRRRMNSGVHHPAAFAALDTIVRDSDIQGGFMVKVSNDSRTVHFRLVCELPPEEQVDFLIAEFGLQDKQEHVHPGESQPDGSLVYRFDLEAVPGQSQEAIRWRGTYVHGRPAAPFLYLSLRCVGAEPSQWAKRIKVPLQGITSRQVETANKMEGAVLEGRVSGKGSGTVALLGDGWSVRSATDRAAAVSS